MICNAPAVQKSNVTHSKAFWWGTTLMFFLTHYGEFSWYVFFRNTLQDEIYMCRNNVTTVPQAPVRRMLDMKNWTNNFMTWLTQLHFAFCDMAICYSNKSEQRLEKVGDWTHHNMLLGMKLLKYVWHYCFLTVFPTQISFSFFPDELQH